jgi:uncharacterized membrane protein
MSTYELFLFVHVMAAIIWVGGDVMNQVMAVRVLRSSDPRRLATFAADIEWVGNRLLLPASLTLIVAAVVLMIDGDIAWDALWVSLSLAAYIASFVAGAAFFGPESGRIGKLVAEQGPESPEAADRIRRILVGTRIQLVVLLAVVYLMTVKPTSDDTGALLLLAVGVVVLAVLLLRGAGRRSSADAGTTVSETA